MDKFAALQKHLVLEIDKLKGVVASPEQHARNVGKIEGLEIALSWVVELNAIEVVEQQDIYES